MWAITHIPTGIQLRDFSNRLFYSEKEARSFFNSLKRKLHRLTNIYVLSSTHVYSVSFSNDKGDASSIQLYGTLRSLKNTKTLFFSYRKTRFFKECYREHYYTKQHSKLLSYIFLHYPITGRLDLPEVLEMIDNFNIYFIVHRIN